MPVIIPISGIISKYEMEEESNVTPSSFRKSLEAANGEDVLITINSPGGSVFPGLEMFSLIQNYPGNTETRIVSLAASMGSILALAGNKKSAENTALYFVHNAQGMGMGDYRDLAKNSEFLKDVSVLLANLYAEFTPLSLKEVRDFMDEDSQFFGSDLELLGFEIVKSENAVNQSEARIDAKLRFKEVENKLSKEEMEKDFEKIAAVIDVKKFGIKNKNEQNPAGIKAENNIIMEGSMPLKNFLKENPAAQDEHDAEIKAAQKAGIEKGKDELKNKIDKVVNFLNNENYPEEIKNVAIEVLKGKKTIEEFNALIVATDMFLEMQKADAAKKETDATGDTKRDESTPAPADGQCNNEADFQAEIRRAKEINGLEVK